MSSRRNKGFVIPVIHCRLFRRAVAAVPSATGTLQPVQNVRHIIERFRDFCRLINRGNSAPGTPMDCFAGHFHFSCSFVSVSKSPADWDAQKPTGRGTPIHRGNHKDVVCWQATDKTVGRYCLLARAGILAKRFLGTLAKVAKLKTPCF